MRSGQVILKPYFAAVSGWFPKGIVSGLRSIHEVNEGEVHLDLLETLPSVSFHCKIVCNMFHGKHVDGCFIVLSKPFKILGLLQLETNQ